MCFQNHSQVNSLVDRVQLCNSGWPQTHNPLPQYPIGCYYKCTLVHITEGRVLIEEHNLFKFLKKKYSSLICERVILENNSFRFLKKRSKADLQARHTFHLLLNCLGWAWFWNC